MTATTSLTLAQLMSMAIASAYGFAILGLWVQYRRPMILGFARAWLMLGIMSAVTALLAPYVGRPGTAPAGTAQVAISFAIGGQLLVGLLWVDAALLTVDARRARRQLWSAAAPAVVLGTLALILAGDAFPLQQRVVVTRVLSTLCIGGAAVVLWRQAPFIGQKSSVAALLLIFARVAAAIALSVLAPNLLTATSQPLAFTMFQLLTTMVAGFFTTVAIFAVERETTVRERLALERAVASAQRTDSLGRMAGSVAHDFNNILAAVLGSSELASITDATGEERAAAASEIQQAVARGKALTDRLLAFGKAGPEQTALYDPVGRLEELVALLQRVAGSQVAVALDISGVSGPHTVNGDPVQFDQMLLNLTANARDAMPGGGRLQITCSLTTSADSRKRTGALRVGHSLTLSIADNGTGIPAAIRDRIFDPFFTTKDDGKGTGLGLATANAFIQSSGGAISVESAEGLGTTFIIQLPIAAAP